ncbi:TPA: hypothetical protein N1953_001422 [Pseudomonas aeruginosa AC9A]|nr:hypothetical protein [Pseudomonas aeruginosa AC9A]
MGRKVAKPRAPRDSSASGQEPGADDLEILHPDRTVEIHGRTVTMREYGFVEGLKLRATMQPFLDDLHAMVVNDRGLPPLDRIIDVLASHHSLVVQLIAQAADVELEWIEELPARPGKNLMFLWWIVNDPFFVGEVMDRISAERAELSSHAGPTPMPASSPEATAASPTSGA